MASLNGYLQGYESDDPPNKQWNEQFEEEESNKQPHNYIPLPPGLQTQQFNSYNEVIELLNTHGCDNGYAVNKKQVKKVKSGSHVKSVWIKCDRGSQYASHIEEGQQKRKTSTIKTDCPFEIITRLQDSLWCVEVKDHHHNHNPSPATTHVSIHRQQVAENATQIKAQLQIGLPTHHIITSLQQIGATGIIDRDIYNLRHQAQQEFLDGKTPIQCLLLALPASGDWIVNHQKDENNVVEAVFITHKSCIELLQMNGGVLFMDSTYKTNQYQMLLLDIIGMAATGDTFYAAFGFMHDETEDTYGFILKCLSDVLLYFRCGHPQTIVTDKEKGLYRAIKKEFGFAGHILCI